MPDDAAVFRVSFICLGNRCRSPYAAALFERMTAGLPVEVTSAGLLDAAGFSAPDEILTVSRAAQLDLAEHRSKPLSALRLAEADLVLGFELAHVAGAVIDGGAPRDRTFTLGELARLMEDVPARGDRPPTERARAVVADAAGLRRGSGLFYPEEDVADPFQGPMDGYEAMATKITALTTTVVDGLFGASVRA